MTFSFIVLSKKGDQRFFSLLHFHFRDLILVFSLLSFCFVVLFALSRLLSFLLFVSHYYLTFILFMFCCCRCCCCCCLLFFSYFPRQTPSRRDFLKSLQFSIFLTKSASFCFCLFNRKEGKKRKREIQK